nr:PREDICTED: protein D2-like isoform X6 [Bemisia tabaci]
MITLRETFNDMFTMHVPLVYGLMTTMQPMFFSMATDKGLHCDTGNFERLLKMHEIIPDLIKVAPDQCLHVEINGKVLNPGDAVDFVDTLEKPNKIEWKHENGTFYSLIMTGLDVPTQEDPHDRESQHWVVGNIPGNNITAGDVLFPYEPAGVEYNEGIHRVVFLVYKQALPLKFTDRVSEISEGSIFRSNFSTAKFSEKYKLGLPIAINFYEFDMEH